jgi:ParB/Sulfiredoxin domain
MQDSPALDSAPLAPLAAQSNKGSGALRTDFPTRRLPEILRLAGNRTLTFPIANIIERDHLRALHETTVQNLCRSIAAIGFLIDPIVLLEAPDFSETRRTFLLAGRHRLEAFRRAGYSTIPARVLKLDDAKAALVAVDSNLIRKNLSPAEEAIFLAEHKRLFESVCGPAKAAGARAANAAMGRQPNASDNVSFAFTTATAGKTGASKRGVQRAVRRSEILGTDFLRAIRGTELDRGVILDKLVVARPEERQKVLEDVRAGNTLGPRALKSALGKPRMPPLRKESAVDQLTICQQAEYEAMQAAWNSASPAAQAAFRKYIG